MNEIQTNSEVDRRNQISFVENKIRHPELTGNDDYSTWVQIGDALNRVPIESLTGIQAEPKILKGQNIFEYLDLNQPDKAMSMMSKTARITAAYLNSAIDQKGPELSWLRDGPSSNQEEANFMPLLEVSFLKFELGYLDNILKGPDIACLPEVNKYFTLKDNKFPDVTSNPNWHIALSTYLASAVRYELGQSNLVDNYEVMCSASEAVSAAAFHDLGRMVSQGSEHDKILSLITHFMNVSPNVISAIHNAVPIPSQEKIDDALVARQIDSDYKDSNISIGYDSLSQAICRLCDVNGKPLPLDFVEFLKTADINNSNDRAELDGLQNKGIKDQSQKALLDSTELLQKYSQYRQLFYLKKGDDQWNGLNNPEEAIRIYTEREAATIESAVKLLADKGVDWWKIIKTFNSNPDDLILPRKPYAEI
jgi:hypothetical protein